MEFNEKTVQRWRDDALAQIAVRNKCIAWVCVVCFVFYLLLLIGIIALAGSESEYEDAIGPVVLFALLAGGVLLWSAIKFFKKQQILDNEIRRRKANENNKALICAAQKIERKAMGRNAAYIVAAAVGIIVVASIIAIAVSDSGTSDNEPWKEYGMDPGEYYEKVWDYNDD